ncbi:UbiA family prenyltransferase [Streptomyces sp. NPDC053048]|uniref:UbiA family prenyltransferase n=1 Tax=Streptomyces sp. NPDC053048 TaxID=3365694 RepID=UPI0037D16FF0
METYQRPPDAGGRTDRRAGLPAVALAGACHPGPVAAVTALATALAATAGQSALRCVLAGAAVLTGQLSVGWSNDAVDARRDARTGRRDKPVASGRVSEEAVWRAAFTAGALCVPLSLACGPMAGVVHLTGVASAWAYNLRLKSTAWSWLPYAVGFASLPAFVALGLPGRPWPAWWAVTAGALLGIGAHLADVLPDIGHDLRTGVRGLPQRLGTRGTRRCLPVPLVAATAVLALGPGGAADAAGQVAVAVAASAALSGAALDRRWGRAPFAAAVVVAALDVGLLLVRGSGLV